MKKETLQAQWNRLCAEAIQIEESHLNEFFEKHPKAETLFRVDPIGNIKQIEIVGFGICYSIDGRSINKPYLIDDSKRPTNKHITQYAEYIDLINKAERRVIVKYKDTGSGAYRYNEIKPEQGLAFLQKDLEEESTRRRELYAPREGYEPCAYCRKQAPIENLIQHKIYGRDRKQVWNGWKGRYESKAYVTERYMKFCSAKCAGNEQMSREG